MAAAKVIIYSNWNQLNLEQQKRLRILYASILAAEKRTRAGISMQNNPNKK